MVTQPPSRAVVLAVLGFALSCVSLTLYVWLSLGGSVPFQPKQYRFHALFGEASQLATNADVRISGIDVGRVVKIRQRGLRTEATIELESPYAPLPADTRAILRQKTLLGETFVEITPGTRGAPKLAEGGTLPPSQVARTQPLDRVLGSFDREARRNTGLLLDRTSRALAGRGDEVNAALGNVGEVTDQLDAIAAILDRQGDSVEALVRDTGVALNAVASRRADVQRLVASGERVVSATAERDRELTATVRALPPFLRTLRSTLGAADRSLALAAPSFEALEPAAPLLRPAVREITRFGPEMRAFLSELGALLPTVERALPAATRIVDAVTPFTRILYPAAREITPVIDLVHAYRQELLGAVTNVGAALQATLPAASGEPEHYLRFVSVFYEEALTGYSQRLPSNRHNPYFAPGSLAQIGREGLAASDCRNTTNPQTVSVIGSGAPPCREQPPWEFKGLSRYFPHVERAEP